MEKLHAGELLSDICVDDMNISDWLEARKHGPSGDRKYTIGGSAVAAALGISPYCSKQQLWDEKKGIYPKITEKKPVEIFERGHFFESMIARLLEKDLKEEYGEDNVILGFDKYIYGCGERYSDGSLKYPYMVINYDANVRIRINGVWKFYLVEIKTLSSTDFETHRDWRNGIVPIEYEYQGRYYMKALDVDGIFFCCAWGFDKNDRAKVFVERDTVIEEEMMESLDEFIWSLEMDIKPEISENENTEKLLKYWSRKHAIEKEKETPMFEIPQTYENQVKLLVDIDRKLCDLTQQNEMLFKKRNEVLAEMFKLYESNREGFFSMDNDTTVYIRRKDSYERDSFDEKEFEKNEPELFKEFTTTSSKIDVTKLKRKHAAIAAKYVIPGKAKGDTEFIVSVYDKKTGNLVQRKKGAFGWEMNISEQKKIS